MPLSANELRLALACSYLYFDWKKKIKLDLDRIESFTEHNFSRYHQMIDMMQAKIQSEKTDIKSVLNTTKYNKFLGCGKIYVDVSGSYLIDFKGADPTVISEFGMESFALLPGKEFFDSFLALGESKFYLDKEIIFLAKYIDDKFIVLKIDAKDFVSQIASKTTLKGKISFHLKTGKDAVSPMSNLKVDYRPISFTQFLQGYSNIFLLILLASLLSTILWGMMFLSFNKKALKPQLIANPQDISLLNKKLEQSQRYAAGLESSISTLSTFAASYFKKNDFEAENITVSLSQIISDSNIYRTQNEYGSKR